MLDLVSRFDIQGEVRGRALAQGKYLHLGHITGDGQECVHSLYQAGVGDDDRVCIRAGVDIGMTGDRADIKDILAAAGINGGRAGVGAHDGDNIVAGSEVYVHLFKTDVFHSAVDQFTTHVLRIWRHTEPCQPVGRDIQGTGFQLHVRGAIAVRIVIKGNHAVIVIEIKNIGFFILVYEQVGVRLLKGEEAVGIGDLAGQTTLPWTVNFKDEKGMVKSITYITCLGGAVTDKTYLVFGVILDDLHGVVEKLLGCDQLFGQDQLGLDGFLDRPVQGEVVGLAADIVYYLKLINSGISRVEEGNGVEPLRPYGININLH